MGKDSSNVLVAGDGTISINSGTGVAPVDGKTALGVGWVDCGYVSDAGVSEDRKRTQKTIVAWQGAEVVRTIITDSSITIKCVLIETTAQNVKIYYGSDVDPTDGSIIIDTGETGGLQGWIVDALDGEEWIRSWVPAGEVTDVGTLQYASDGAVGYECTITGYPSPLLLNTAGKQCSMKKWFSKLVLPAG